MFIKAKYHLREKRLDVKEMKKYQKCLELDCYLTVCSKTRS